MSASLAAVLTTPFDVVKTKQQTAKNGSSSSIVQCLVKVCSSLLRVVMSLFSYCPSGQPLKVAIEAFFAIRSSWSICSI